MSARNPYSPGPERSRWHADGLRAVLTDDRGAWQARIEVREWFADQSRESNISWVVEWPVPGGAAPYMYEAPIEQPALVADTDDRKAELARLARAAMTSPRTTAPDPFEGPTKPMSADAWADLLERQTSCWVDSFGELCHALEDTRTSSRFLRYRRAVEALGWIYTLDQSLSTLWGTLSAQARELESLQTDAQAASSIANNSQIVTDYSANEDGAFGGYFERQQTGAPYSSWSDLLLAGVFQGRFFIAISYVRGQLVHIGADLPMELRQYRPGAEPRWKFSDSSSFSRGAHVRAGRRVYDQALAGWDVIGGLGHLTDVFADAQRRLTARLRAEEMASPE